MRRIGIDVGGTNTDAVLLDNDKVIFACKRPTTLDVTSGILDALKALRADPVTRGPVDSVVIGTTHFINAVVQRKHLMKVAAIRIGMPVSASLPPFCDWPVDLADKVHGETFMLEGGHDFDGRPIMPFDTSAMRSAAKKIRDAGLRSVAVSSIFSPLDPSCEIAARDILHEICPDVAVTMSHDLGRIGLLERENAALLNAVLHDLAVETVAAFRKAIAESGIDAPLFLTQNDGTVMQAEAAIAFPVMSFASGATNSMRGAAHLSGREDAMVVDVGGTTSDIGQLKNGFPREANAVVEVGGVRTLFRMPDLLSIGLGGGSHVATSAKVGPLSVGYRLTEDALVFGGTQLTTTDIAVAAGLLDIGDRSRVASISKDLIKDALADAKRLLEENIDRMKTEAADAPLVAVGGGAFLVPDKLAGVSEIIRVPFGDCANAVGAAIARVSGEADQVFRELSRDDAIAAALQIANDKAIVGGADPASLKTIEVEDMPIAYLPGNSLRVRVRVAGALASVATKQVA